MTNPRKFSEKIALHTQKQAEETAAFEEIMREVVGATRKSNATCYGEEQQQHQQHLSTPAFSVARAGSLPNVAQMVTDQVQLNLGGGSQQASPAGDKSIDLQGALSSLQAIKNGVLLDRSASMRADAGTRRNHFSNMGHQQHQQQQQQQQHQQHLHHQRRSPSPYSIHNTAYLSPPPPDGSWRRTASDSALHQSVVNAGGAFTSPHQHLQQQQQMLQQMHQQQQQQGLTDGNNLSPRRASPAMAIGPGVMLDESSVSGENVILLSASLPDHQMRPRSCEVPGINIYPSQDESAMAAGAASAAAATNGDTDNGHGHIPISSNTGSLPDLTSLHFPVPLHTPIDSEGQQHMDESGQMQQQQQQHNGYGNGSMMAGTPTSPGSPFSPTSSVHSNLSPPPPCNVVNNNGNNSYNQSQSQSPRSRQASPGPCPSPTSTRRRAHHVVNSMVMGGKGHRQQQQQQQQQGLVMDGGNMNGINGQQQHQYKSLNSPTASYGSPTTDGSGYNQQFQFNSPPALQNFNTMSMHRSTTPTDSCSAPCSPASQSLSPANSPELPTNNINGGGTNGDNSGGYSPNYVNYLNQANVVQHQLEQFRMTNDSDTSYMLTDDMQNTNAFYLNNANLISMNQYTTSTIQQHQQQQQQQDMNSPNSSVNSPNGLNFFTTDSSQLYYDSSGMIDGNGMIYMKTSEISSSGTTTTMIDGNTIYTQQQLGTNSSQCTTPQTPTSIPDIILTGPTTLDDIQTDFAKDLNNTIVNLNNMGSFDSDIFGPSSEDTLRGVGGGSFDSFDLDSLQMLPDAFDVGVTTSTANTAPNG